VAVVCVPMTFSSPLSGSSFAATAPAKLSVGCERLSFESFVPLLLLFAPLSSFAAFSLPPVPAPPLAPPSLPASAPLSLASSAAAVAVAALVLRDCSGGAAAPAPLRSVCGIVRLMRRRSAESVAIW